MDLEHHLAVDVLNVKIFSRDHESPGVAGHLKVVERVVSCPHLVLSQTIVAPVGLLQTVDRVRLLELGEARRDEALHHLAGVRVLMHERSSAASHLRLLTLRRVRVTDRSPRVHVLLPEHLVVLSVRGSRIWLPQVHLVGFDGLGVGAHVNYQVLDCVGLAIFEVLVRAKTMIIALVLLAALERFHVV